MAKQLYRFWDLVVYAGQYWRVMGHQGGDLYLRAPGWEYACGWWGINGYGWPIQVATVAPTGSPLLYHA